MNDLRAQFRRLATLSSLRVTLVAGVLGHVAFELYAYLISPVLFGVTLQPARLLVAIAATADIGLPYTAAFLLHTLIGTVGVATLVFLVRSFVTRSVWIGGVGSGVGLWFVAQGVLAPIAGRSFMMDFGAYTQSSFVAHVGMTLLIAVLFERAGSRASQLEPLAAQC